MGTPRIGRWCKIENGKTSKRTEYSGGSGGEDHGGHDPFPQRSRLAINIYVFIFRFGKTKQIN